MHKSLFALGFKPKRSSSDGFTLVEVLVGVLLTLTFVGISTQAFVVSAMFKVRGQELSEATTWMQQDAENLRFEASRLNISGLEPLNPEHNNRCSAGDATQGYADLLRDDILTKEGNSETNAAVSPKDIDRESSIGQRPYVLRRVMTPATTAPFNVLQISYAVYAKSEEPSDVTDTVDEVAIATSYSEIIPNASFACE